MTKLAIKKTFVAGAVLLTGLVPSASAAAATGTNISTSQNTNANVSANKSNSNSSADESYFNKTVNYEALSYVKYSATTTAYTKSMQDSANQASLDASFSKSADTNFSMMPEFMHGWDN